MRARNIHTTHTPRAFRNTKVSPEVLHRAAFLPTAARTLKVTKCYTEDSIVLTFTGTLDTTALSAFRDSVFRAIGERPTLLCLDLSSVSDPLDSEAMHVLVTAARVAAMVEVNCRIIPRNDLREVLHRSHLDRLIPVLHH